MKISNGVSKKDRITFSTQKNSATAIRNENGDIEINYEKSADDNLIKSIIAILVVFGGLSLIKAFILIPLIRISTISNIWYLLPVFVYLFLLIISIFDVRVNGKKEQLMNHGAEHKVFSAYKKLKRIPTVEEAKRFSRINKVCGISIYSAFITCQFIGFVIFCGFGYKIPELILFLIPLFFSTRIPFSLIGEILQVFTTSNPNDESLELAIAAISALEEREASQNYIEMRKEGFEIRMARISAELEQKLMEELKAEENDILNERIGS